MYDLLYVYYSSKTAERFGRIYIFFPLVFMIAHMPRYCFNINLSGWFLLKYRVGASEMTLAKKSIEIDRRSECCFHNTLNYRPQLTIFKFTIGVTCPGSLCDSSTDASVLVKTNKMYS